MDNARQQIVDSIRQKSNILVTVSTNPSVDELSAALGLTLLLDGLDKRATAVVSGAIPPAITFLEPDKTFDTSADSLRDFIIALDKEKADHLRYKVEGDVVKIFITPYKTTLTQSDLEFSQGDYNVELVVALGVKDQGNLDKALEAHGKILHDATVVTLTAGNEASTLGSIDWHDATASSISEMVASIADGLKEDKPLLNEQISTALLTGIVSSTDRFSNDRTSSQVMTMAAQLMAAGANQQLIAAKLEEAHDIGPGSIAGHPDAKPDIDQADDTKTSSDGTELVIERDEPKEKKVEAPTELVIEPPVHQPDAPKASQDTIDQLELEKQLAGLAPAAPTGTVEDIEKELQDAVAEAVVTTPTEAPSTETPPAEAPPVLPEPVADESANEPFTAASDSAMPGFEPTPPPTLPTLPTLQAPPPSDSPVQPAAVEPPKIVQDHGAFAASPPEGTPPINSIQDNPNEGEGATIDPFSGPAPTQPSTPVEVPSNVGTPEGAALLSANEPVAAAPPLAPLETPPALEPVAAIPTLPPLPR